LAASFVLTSFLRTFLFGVAPTDALTYFGAVVLLAAVALTACYVPARRAMAVEPIVVLRYQ
jgi:ABC-type lipoprotein release transport system permease subunit